MPITTTHTSSLLIKPCLWIVLVLMFAVVPKPSQAATELEGYVPEITTQKVFFGGKYYALIQGKSIDNKIKWPQGTECYVKGNPTYQVTCGTLAQIGYIDKAKLRIENDKVIRIELLRLMQ